MYLSETEEIIAFIVCIAIVIGFAVSTYLEIKNTISEEKNKYKDKIENEAKIKQAIELCAIYWHFLLIVWFILFGLMIAT